MPTQKHYFVERNERGRFAVRAKGSKRASALFDTQREAIQRAKEMNQADRPNVERVRNLKNGGRDQWRSAEKKSQRK